MSDVTGNAEYVLEAEMSGAELQSGESKDVSLKRVSISGSLSAVDSEYLFRGRICADYSRPCDRCLEQSVRRYELDVTCIFVHGANPAEALEDLDEDIEYEINEAEQSDGFRYFEGVELDLRTYVREEVALSAPSKFLCEDDCQGLCVQCGANLNARTCRCTSKEPSKQNTGLAALGDIFPELASGPSEDG